MHSNRIVTAISALCFSVCLGGSAIADLGDCGQPSTAGPSPTATDALAILFGAVGLQVCDIAICDINCSSSVTASDALTVLQFAVGQPVTLNCSCETTTTTTTTTTTSTTTTTTVGMPALTAGDFPGVTPCSDRDTLASDSAFAAALADATQIMFTVNFTQFDSNGFPEICGLADADNTLDPSDIPWDPDAMNDIRLCKEMSQYSDFTQFFSNAVTAGGPDFCQTTTMFGGTGFPRSGVYRKDYCLESAGNSYAARVRKTISGPQADADFSSAGIAIGDVRVCNGTTLIASDTDARALIAENPGGFTITLRDSDCASGAELLSVQIEVICIKELSSACPWDFGCPQ